MRRKLALLLAIYWMGFSIGTILIGNTYIWADDTLGVSAPSVVLMEASTGTVIYEKNPDERMHPASVTKIMTLLLIFDAISEGKISLTDQVTVSEYTASMGGSQVFLEPGEVQDVNTMIKCIAVASANDACVAMAEYIWGTESEFVSRMNQKATELGMSNTHFVNCCGLDEAEHLTTARDIAIMSRELITKYPQIHDYSAIWMDTITHVTRRGESAFGLTNTNKLMKQYEWATGLKTGSTSQAGCCLSATANKNGIELIAVILAAPTSKNRFQDAVSLLNYGYSICNIYKDEERIDIPDIAVIGGKQDHVAGNVQDVFTYLAMQNEDLSKVNRSIEEKEGVHAPIKTGDVIGWLVYRIGDTELGRVDILAAADVAQATYFDSFRKVFVYWADLI